MIDRQILTKDGLNGAFAAYSIEGSKLLSEYAKELISEIAVALTAQSIISPERSNQSIDEFTDLFKTAAAKAVMQYMTDQFGSSEFREKVKRFICDCGMEVRHDS